MQMRTALNPAPQSLVIPAIIAFIGHSVAVLLLVGISMLEARKPKPILDDQFMDVSMMILPKSNTRMPEKAQHRPNNTVPPAQTDTVEPKSESLVKDVPVKTSDLSLKKQSNPQKTKTVSSNTVERQRKMDDALRQALMQDALTDLSTPEGATDRQASDPNSTSTESTNTQGSSLSTDPAFSKYKGTIQRLFTNDFRPLPAIVQANPGLKCTILVRVDPNTGTVIRYEFLKKSGNPSFDRSAESAVQAVSKVPLPSDKYRHHLNDGFVVVFEPS